MKSLFMWNANSAKVEDALREMMICEAKAETKVKNKGKEVKKFEESLIDKAELMKLAGKFKDVTVPFVLAALLKKIKTDPAFIDEDEEDYNLYNELAKIVKKALESSKNTYTEIKFKNVEPEAEKPVEDEVEKPEEKPAEEEKEPVEEKKEVVTDEPATIDDIEKDEEEEDEEDEDKKD